MIENISLIIYDLRCTGERNKDQCSIKRPLPILLHPIASGRINTIESFSFLYGKVDIRAKLPTEEWVFPQLFLESTGSLYGKTNLESGQMRVAFTRGINGTLLGGVLLAATEPLRTAKMCSYNYASNTEWRNDFHVFSLDWRPSKKNNLFLIDINNVILFALIFR